MVFCLTSAAVDLFVEPAGRALFEIGDDEAGVGALIADFDPGDDPLDPAPAFGAIVERLEAAHFACACSTGERSIAARFGAGFQIGDMAAQGCCGRNAEDKIVATRATPVENLGTAIMAVTAQQNLCLWPMATDHAQQAPQERPDFRALWPFGRAQDSGYEAALAIEYDDGLKAVFVMVGIEQAQLPAAMYGVKCVINVEHNALGHGGETVAVQIDHGPAHAQQGARIRQVFQARDCRLRTQCAVRRGKVERHLEHRIDAQAARVISILITRRDHHQPEADDVGKAVRDMLGRAWILDAGRQTISHPKTLLDLAQQQNPAVG